MTVEPQQEHTKRFQYTEADLREIYQMRISPLILYLVLLCLFIIYTVFSSIHNNQSVFSVLFVAEIVLGVFMSYRIIAEGKNLKTYIARATEAAYECTFGESVLIVRRFLGEEQISENTFRYEEISKVYRQGNWIVLRMGTLAVSLRNDWLPPNSVLFSYIFHNSQKVKEETTKDGWWIASILLFVGALASLYIGLFMIMFATGTTGDMTQNMWLLYLVTPIPLASVAFSFVLKRKGRKYKKNLIAGVIMTVLLCIYGSFTFIFKDIPPSEVPTPTAYHQTHLG